MCADKDSVDPRLEEEVSHDSGVSLLCCVGIHRWTNWKTLRIIETNSLAGWMLVQVHQCIRCKKMVLRKQRTY